MSDLLSKDVLKDMAAGVQIVTNIQIGAETPSQLAAKTALHWMDVAEATKRALDNDIWGEG